MRTTDFDFILPEALIAQFPAKQRSASRLLRLDGAALTKQSESELTKPEPSKPEPSKPELGKPAHSNISDALFTQLPQFLSPDDLLVFNDTRVIKARLSGRKASGGSVEVMVERVIDSHHAHALIRASRAPKPGSRILLADSIEVTVVSREDDLFLLEFNSDTPVLELLERYGALPLPPYITHSADAEDDERYQTVYAKEPGAVAAPTAGLHFDEAMLQRLQQQGVNIAYVTLHVGAGTFQPVRVDNIAEHKMHSELYSVPQVTVDKIQQAKQAGGKVTCVGTTSLRALESAARSGQLMAGSGETDIFISPGYQFKVAERLLTNFHLPKSTLLMLVSAFAGMDNIRAAYQHAIAQQYRFFSYGDAMLIERQ